MEATKWPEHKIINAQGLGPAKQDWPLGQPCAGGLGAEPPEHEEAKADQSFPSTKVGDFAPQISSLGRKSC